MKPTILVALLLLALLLSAPREVAAAPIGNPDVNCEVWAVVSPWIVTRCESEDTGEVCFQSSSGMFQCRLDW